MKYLRISTTLLVCLLWNQARVTGVFAEEQSIATSSALWGADEAILAENTQHVVDVAANLSPADQFEKLSAWVLPTTTRPTFRMNAQFLQTNPVPGSFAHVADGISEGILAPCFALVKTAQHTGQLDELQRRLESIPDPADPDQLRAKLALLLMVHSARGDEESTLELCNRLLVLVRSRGPNLDGRWWPETLALAWGMREIKNRVDLQELATAIYELQIAQSLGSGSAAWDNFVAGCYARLRMETSAPEPELAGGRNLFRSWKAASVISARTRGNGSPSESWHVSQDAAHKLMGHDHDFLYFPIPLTGNFEINCDVSSFNFRESQVAWAGLYASHYYTLKQAEIGEIRTIRMVPLNPPLTYPDDWLTCRIVVHEGTARHFINGQLFHERKIASDSFPWLALRGYRLSRGAVRDLTITGSPQIPSRIDLLTEESLNGWFVYFEEPVADSTKERSWRFVSAEKETPELIHPVVPELAGTSTESLLLYHRPIMEDGVIEYEFYYEPGRVIVHPAIDRLCILMEPDGVRTHWITDGKYQRNEFTPRSVAFSEGASQRTRPPLQPNAWNKTTLSLQGNDVAITLNGTKVFAGTLDASSRRQFGLFHFCDQSQVRVRNMQWTGDWPKSAEPPMFPPAVQAKVASIDEAVKELPLSYHHSFRESKLPDLAFTKKKSTITATNDGALSECSGEGRWQQTDLTVALVIGGDFDLRASFKNLDYLPKGGVGAQLVATLAETGQEIRIARNRWSDGPEMMKCQIGTSRVNGRWEYADTWSKQASREGVFRLVRIADKLHFLFAESEVSGFRLLHTDQVGRQDLRLGDTSLSVFVQKDGWAKCTWTDLHVRAARLSGLALLDSEEILSKLNDEREKLPVHRVFDFEKGAPKNVDFYFDPNETQWSEASQGLVMKATGQTAWTASLMGSRMPLNGDFDVTLNFGEFDLILPGNGQFSTLMFQVQQLENERTRFASMFRRTSTEYKAVAQQHRTLPDGRHEYSWHGDVTVNSVASLRIARRGKVYTMLARPVDGQHDQIIHQTEHVAGSVLLHTLLHSGMPGKDSKVVLKSIEVHAE